MEKKLINAIQCRGVEVNDALHSDLSSIICSNDIAVKENYPEVSFVGSSVISSGANRIIDADWRKSIRILFLCRNMGTNYILLFLPIVFVCF